MANASEREFKQLANRSVIALTEAMNRLINATARGADTESAEAAVEDIIISAGILGDLIGRARALKEGDAAVRSRTGEPVAEFSNLNRTPNPQFPDLTFHEAVDQILLREPRLAAPVGGETIAEAVARQYTEGPFFVLARATIPTVTERVQATLTKSLDEGFTRVEAVRRITVDGQLDNFSRAYAETVYRTNLNTAYTAGRFRQFSTPDMQAIFPAIRYKAIKDSDVRRGREEDNGEDHAGLDGLVAAITDPIWNVASPPNGYNCRCGIEPMTEDMLRDGGHMTPLGIVKPNMTIAEVTPKIHPNFRSRGASTSIYG
jgi:SPP1 gp7 family putative phage head morphogenesis protein